MTVFKTIYVFALVFLIGSLLSPLWVGAKSRDQKVEKRTRDTDKWVQTKMEQMSLREKVGQMMMARSYGLYMNASHHSFREIKRLIVEHNLGGFILSNWFDERGVMHAPDVYETAVLANKMQRMAKVPLLFAADFERGVAHRIRRAVSFPENMALGATASEEYAYFEGKVTALEARAIGVHWTFAPIADVNSNPQNPIINTRSYGEDPHNVAKLVAAYIRGAQENGIMATAKHFPGHGDTGTDSHSSLPIIEVDKKRLDEIELIPFKAAIAANVDSIMTAHIAVTKLDGKTPATLSHVVLTDLLRTELGFKGLIVTDALEMGGITNSYSSGDAAVRAVKAGADMILLPPDTEAAIRAVVKAVEANEIPHARINASVERILNAKAWLGLNKDPLVDLEEIDKIFADEGNQRKAQEIADRSITVVKNDEQALPINPKRPQRLLSVVVSDERDPDIGSLFQRQIRERTKSVTKVIADQRTCSDEMSDALKKAAESDLVLCSVFSRWRDRKGTVAVPHKQARFVEQLLQLGKPIVLISFGSPYILSQFPQAKTYVCAYGLHDVSQRAAAKAIFGEIDTKGKLPVSLSGVFPIGHGLRIGHTK